MRYDVVDVHSEHSGLAPASTDYLEHQLEAILRDMLTAGHLLAVTLTTEDGLPIASLEGMDSTGILAGLSALFSEVGVRAEQLLEWPPLDELSLSNQKGVRLVIRLLHTRHARILMVVLVPAHQTYRRVTTVAIRRLLPLLEQLWSTSPLVLESRV